MKIIAIIILIWVYAVSITGFIEIFKQLNEELLLINISSEFLGIIFGIMGLLLGIGYYFLSDLNNSTKNILTISIPTVILLIILFSYIIYDINGFYNLLFNLLKIGILFLISGLPSIAIYSILKNQKNVLLSCGAGIMVFFFMIIFLSQQTGLELITIYSEQQIPFLLFFFILFLLFLELGSNSAYYTNSLNKMTPNQYIDQNTLYRFNRVINKQLAYISILFTTCFFASLLILWNSNYNKFLKIDQIFGVEIASFFGIILLVFFLLTGLTILWFLIPVEKKQNQLIEN